MLCVQPLVTAQRAGSVLGGVGLAKGGHSKGEQTGALTAEFWTPSAVGSVGGRVACVRGDEVIPTTRVLTRGQAQCQGHHLRYFLSYHLLRK